MATLIIKEEQKKALLKKFHTLLGQTDNREFVKEVLLSHYGVSSSRDLTERQLSDACTTLENQAGPAQRISTKDKWRKRLIAAVSDYLRVMGIAVFQKEYKDCTKNEKEYRTEYAKGTAIKASRKMSFDKIPQNQLVNLYNGFIKMKNDLLAVEQMTMEILSNN